jgi:hypothetical protein
MKEISGDPNRFPESLLEASQRRLRISKGEALKIATRAFEAAKVDFSVLHLGKPKITRWSQAHPTKDKVDLKMPGFVIEWKDDAEGTAICVVSGVSKQIVKWNVLSKWVPRCPSECFYGDLGITNIPPPDVGPLMR